MNFQKFSTLRVKCPHQSKLASQLLANYKTIIISVKTLKLWENVKRLMPWCYVQYLTWCITLSMRMQISVFSRLWKCQNWPHLNIPPSAAVHGANMSRAQSIEPLTLLMVNLLILVVIFGCVPRHRRNKLLEGLWSGTSLVKFCTFHPKTYLKVRLSLDSNFHKSKCKFVQV